MRKLLAALAAGPLLTAACSTGAGLEDIASCPGESCTQDARDRVAALERVPRVSSVQHLERSSRFDRGASRTAAVSARVSDRGQAREVALAALGVLQDWPEADAGPTSVTVVSDPVVTVSSTYREQLSLAPGQFDACSPQACADALEDLRMRLREDYPDLRALHADVVDGTLEVTARAMPDDAALAAAGVRRVIHEIGLRVARDARIVVRAKGPLTLTLRLEDGLVCEQPPGIHVSCDPEDSEPFEDS